MASARFPPRGDEHLGVPPVHRLDGRHDRDGVLARRLETAYLAEAPQELLGGTVIDNTDPQRCAITGCSTG